MVLGGWAAVTAYATDRHYLHIEWTIGVPVPAGWWLLGQAASVLGFPLLLVCLGRRFGDPGERTWWWLLSRWTVPGLLVHAAWTTGTAAVLYRYHHDFTGVPVRDVREYLGVLLAPPFELSLAYAVAFFPLITKLLRRVPAGPVVVTLTAATMVTGVVTALVFLAVGHRLAADLDRGVASATGWALARRGAVALAAVCLPGVPAIPAELAQVLAGLGALPFGLTVAALLSRPGRIVRRLIADGSSGVPMIFFAVPLLCLADAFLLRRISAAGPGPQLAAAVAEPVVLTAIVAVAGLPAAALLRRRGVTW
jgi:hypothetical protein